MSQSWRTEVTLRVADAIGSELEELKIDEAVRVLGFMMRNCLKPLTPEQRDSLIHYFLFAADIAKSEI